MYFQSKSGTMKLVLGRFVYIPISISSKAILLGQKSLTGFIKIIFKIPKKNKAVKKLTKNNDFLFLRFYFNFQIYTIYKVYLRTFVFFKGLVVYCWIKTIIIIKINQKYRKNRIKMKA